MLQQITATNLTVGRHVVVQLGSVVLAVRAHTVCLTSSLAPLTLVSARSPLLAPQDTQLRNDKWERHIIISELLRKKCGDGEGQCKEGKMKNTRVKGKHSKKK